MSSPSTPLQMSHIGSIRYIVPSYLIVIVPFVHYYTLLPPSTHDSEQVPFTGALDLVQSRQVVVKEVVSTCGLVD